MGSAETRTLFSPDPREDAPFYRQIYARVRGAIASGVLKPGDRIPSARALTKELGLARGTIDSAYSLLSAEGYILARGQAGTFVSPGLTLRAPSDSVAATARTPTRVELYRPDAVLPFQMGLPALDTFPRKLWAGLGARCVRAMGPSDMAYPPVFGMPELRSGIAAYLQMSRGIDCSPAQVFVTGGYRHTIQLVCQALLKAGDRAWIENPGFPPTRELLRHLRIDAVPVPVDGEGLMVSEGERRAPGARMAVVTPAHQSPLCVTLSLARRHALLDWARQNGAWIVEDDYDGEFRYVSRPLPALASLDRDGRVLYSGTFSKVLFPGLRLAYLVVPPSLVERVEQVCHTVPGSPQLTQAIVTSFIQEGHFARHIQRMRKLYAERRRATVAGLAEVLGDHVRVDEQPGGMHLVLRLRGDQSDRQLVARMRAAGLYSEALSDWTDGECDSPGVLLGFTNIDSQQSAERFARSMLPLF